MTFLDKLKEDNPNMTEKELIEVMGSNCPDSFGYEDNTTCTNTTGIKDECRGCWNREMPGTEEVAFTSNYHYEKGLNDAWELAKKLYEMKFVETRKIFDGHERLEDIFDNFTPQETLAKLKAYEDGKIEVGDVVEMCYEDEEEKPFKGVVLESGMNGLVTIFDENTNARVWEIEKLKKTGKHIDIKSILEQIGE